MDAKKEFSRWLEHCQGSMLEELKALEGNDAEIQARFGSKASFGTAGIRCMMGVGTARLNDLTVRQTARGLAAYLLSSDDNKSCAIGYDCRHNSQRFAKICAAALAAEGVHVYLYDRLCPTPMLSFAVRYLKTGVGMVISASHNTKEYNGLKCYGTDGGQMTEIPAAAVSKAIQEVDLFAPEKESFESLMEKGMIEYIADDVIICSMTKGVGDSIYTAISEYIGGDASKWGTTWVADLATGYVGIGYGEEGATQQVPDELKAETEELAKKIASGDGEIVVETTR